MPRRKNEADEPIVQSPSCPRCGYDLTGVVSPWVEQCPVEGVCSECGLEFAWCDLLVKDRRKIPWLYEHRQGLAAGCAFEMIPRALLARRFWRKVQLHHRPNVFRLVLFPFVVFFGLWFSSVLAGFFIFGVRYLFLGPDANIGHYSTERSLGFLAFSQFGYGNEYQFHGVYDTRPLLAILSTIGFSGGMALSLLIARSLRRISKVKTSHLIRAFSSGLTIAMLLYAVYTALWLADRIGVEDDGPLQGRHYYSWGSASAWEMIRVTAWSWFMHWRALFGAPILWLMLWWWCALRIGLRLEQWKQVYIAGVFLGALLASSSLLFPNVWLSVIR